MTRLIYADLLRIRTTRTIAWYLAGLIIGVGLGVTGQMVTLSAEELEQEQIFLDTLEASGASTILMLIYGLIGFAGEHRHGTITQMFLATPVRERVVAAKVITFSFVGLLLGLFAIALTIAMALPWMAAKGAQADVFDRDAVLLLLGIVATATLWGGLGAAFGAIAPNQVAAIVIVFTWFFVIENIISGLLPAIAPYTPGGAARGLMGVDEDELLPMGAAATVTAGYVLALSALGAALVMRRDVT